MDLPRRFYRVAPSATSSTCAWTDGRASFLIQWDPPKRDRLQNARVACVRWCNGYQELQWRTHARLTGERVSRWGYAYFSSYGKYRVAAIGNRGFVMTFTDKTRRFQADRYVFRHAVRTARLAG